jgi:hypothetical protein
MKKKTLKPGATACSWNIDIGTQPKSKVKKENIEPGTWDAFLNYSDPAQAKIEKENIEPGNLDPFLKILDPAQFRIKNRKDWGW